VRTTDWVLPTLLLLGFTTGVRGQINPTIGQAADAFNAFDFPRALALARQAVNDEPLSNDDLVVAYELIGFSYGALDSADQAVQALSQMIVLDPDREPNVEALPPRLVNLYNQALGQVLVVRRMLVDSISFVAGFGAVTMHYEVSRPSIAVVRVVGNGTNAVVDSILVNPGEQRYDWDAMIDGRAIPAGEYQLIVSAAEGRNQFQAARPFTVTHGAVDTLSHLTRLEGFDQLPETETPPRDWRPLGVSALLTGLASGAALAIGSSDLGGPRRELIGVSVASLATGLVLSLRTPEARVVPQAVLYNSLLRQQLAETNRRIASDNEEIRRRVRLTIVQGPR